jgi:hypothetical protein
MKKSLANVAFIIFLGTLCLADETSSFIFKAPVNKTFNAAYTAVLKNWTLRHASAKSDTIWFTLYGGRDRIDYDYGVVIEPEGDQSKVTVVLVPERQTPKAQEAEKFAGELNRQMEKFRDAPLDEMVRQHGNRELDDSYEAITRDHPYSEVFAAVKRAAEKEDDLLSVDEANKTVTFKQQNAKSEANPHPGSPLICVINITDQRHDVFRLRIKFRREDSGKVYLSAATAVAAQQYFAALRRELQNAPGGPVINPRN